MIALHQVSFRYPHQEQKALQDISLRLPESGLYLISGPTGCGKSTLGLILAGAIPHIIRGCLNGDVRVAGLNPAALPLRQVARQVGMLLQNVDSQMVTEQVEDEIAFGLENLAVPPAAMQSQVLAALRQVQGEHLLKRRLATLSAGERQRVMLAALLVLGQRVLILDEPLAYLDRRAAVELLRLLARLVNQGITCLVLEHRRALLQPLVRQELGLLQGRLLAQPPEPPVLPPPLPPMPGGSPRLRLEQVTFAWPGASPCLKDISFEVNAGQSLVLLGDNGAGKTTLLKLIAGLYQPQKGTLVFPGLSPGRRRRQLQQDVALVLQNPAQQLRLPTVYQEVAWGAANPAAADKEIDALGLAGLADRHPYALSSGQQRRVTLAAALARKPQILLLDEPTVGHDDANLSILLQRLAAYVQEGGTLVTATHDVRAASFLGQQVLILAQGGAASGGPELAARYFLGVDWQADLGGSSVNRATGGMDLQGWTAQSGCRAS